MRTSFAAKLIPTTRTASSWGRYRLNAAAGLMFLGAGAAVGSAQAGARSGRPATIHWSASAMRLDGALDEAAWQRADSITEFTQRDPVEGAPTTERTVVRLVGTADGLWIGLWAYDSEPALIRHAQMRRDADLGTDDAFTVMLDAQRDQRSGFLFSVNPNGAMYDAEIVNFESENADWDGIWDARARITAWGWQAELFIPWTTLRYPRGATGFGLNFRRYVRHRNEEALWHAWRRPEGIRFLEREGTLQGLRDLPPRSTVELRPYVAGAARLDERGYRADGTDSVAVPAGLNGSAGLDAKLAPTSQLTLDLTLNTDFAQVEADRQVVNLTRFPLFFPERRVFFTEGAGIFDFGRVGQTQLFYSRRIGLSDSGDVIPLDAGARLIGRIGDQQVGLLAVRTGGATPANDIVARVKRDAFGRGYLGAMATVQQSNGRPAALAGGLDFYFPFIVNGQNVVVNGAYSVQRDSADARTAAAWRLVLDYPNDNADINARVERIDSGYAPPLGFTAQSGIYRYVGQFELFPRPHRWGIRRFEFNLLSWNIATNLDQSLNHADYAIRPLGAVFETGDEFGVDVQLGQDVPTASFDLFTGTTVAAGSYRWQRVQVEFSSSGGRPFSVDAAASAGGYYDGDGTELKIAVRHRLEPHLTTSAEWQVDDFHRRGGGFTATTADLRLDYAASPRLTTTLFGQYDNASKHVTVNGRVRWTRSPGSDLYVVLNGAWQQGFATTARIDRPANGALIVKYVQFFLR
ncbi:MAG: hypothetical protein HY084_10900 [Gemmatimonadetes bacterium]|nr:hypothetical protein [Gemmatimonadota bacterium]